MRIIVARIAALLSFLALLVTGCVQGDPLLDDFYTKSLYPGVTNTYSVGRPALQYLNGYFQNVYVNGVAVIPGVAAPHNLLSATHTDTTIGVVARGDLVTGQGVAPKWQRLVVGGANTVLGSDGTDAAWTNTLTNMAGSGTWTAIGTWVMPSVNFNASPVIDNNIPLVWKDAGGVQRDVVNFFNWLDILPASTYDAIVWIGSGTGRIWYLWGTSSTAISTTKDSPTLSFLATYWDAGAGVSTNWEAKIINDMITGGATPKSQLRFPINGINTLRLQNDNGVASVILDGILDANTHQINNVVDPTANQDAATKIYVDSSITGNATITLTTSTDLTGVLKGDGATVSVAAPNVDYVPPTDGVLNGSTQIQYALTAGENIAAYQICYVKSDGKPWLAKADATATMPGLFIATDAITSGVSGNLTVHGFVTNAGWSWTPGNLLYTSNATAGSITATIPTTSTNVIQIVGQAVSATTIYFKPELIMAVLK